MDCTRVQVAVSGLDPEFTRLLVRAGARAAQYNDLLDLAPIHSAVLGGHGELHLPALLSDPANRADPNTAAQPGGETALHLAAARGMVGDCVMCAVYCTVPCRLGA